MQNSGKNGNGNEPTTLPTEPTAVPTTEETTQMKLTVLNSLLAEFQSQKLISITHRRMDGQQVYSINFPVGTWELDNGKFSLTVPTIVPTANKVQIPVNA